MAALTIGKLAEAGGVPCLGKEASFVAKAIRDDFQDTGQAEFPHLHQSRSVLATWSRK